MKKGVLVFALALTLLVCMTNASADTLSINGTGGINDTNIYKISNDGGFEQNNFGTCNCFSAYSGCGIGGSWEAGLFNFTGGVTGLGYMLYEINFSGIPTDAEIVSANLTVWKLADGASNATIDSQLIQMFRTTTNWQEGGQCNGAGESSYDRNFTGETWTSGEFSSTDYDSNLLAQVTMDRRKPYTKHVFEIDNVTVQSIINGTYVNNGFVLKQANQSAGADHVSLGSVDWGNHLSPTFDIEWQAAGAVGDITIQSPENVSYKNNSIPLNWSANGFNPSSAVYELDGVNYSFTEAGGINYTIGNGSVETSGSCTNPENFYDGDWDSFGSAAGGICEYQVDYTDTQSLMISTMYYKYKIVNIFNLTRLVNPNTCDYTDFRMYINLSSSNSIYYCRNVAGDYVQFFNSAGNDDLYEEEVIYEVIKTNITLTGLSEGQHEVRIYANDSGGTLYSSAALFFSIDTVAPSIDFVDPTPSAGTYVNNYIETNVTASDNNTLNITTYLYNSDGTLNTSNTGTSSPHFVNFTGLSDGTYIINATTQDASSNENSTTSITITLDTTSPSITVYSPQNISYVQSNSILGLQVDADETVSAWLYSLNGASNVTFTPNTSITAVADANSIQICANDSVNNINCTTIYFNMYAGNYTIRVLDEQTKISP